MGETRAKEIPLRKFLYLRDLVDKDIISRQAACRALEITNYLYNKWDAQCKNVKIEDIES